METDLRLPTLHKQLDVQPGPGLVDVLIGSISLFSAAQQLDLDSPSANGGGQLTLEGPTFEVLVAGHPRPPNPGELIESRAMEALLEQARSSYDLVVIDTPPLAAVSDAFALLNKVDGVVIVGRVGRKQRDVAMRLHRTLAGAHAPLLGVVANGVKTRRMRDYGYGYDGSYDPPRGEPERPAAVRASVGATTYLGNGDDRDKWGDGAAPVVERVRQALVHVEPDGESVRRSFQRRG